MGPHETEKLVHDKRHHHSDKVAAYRMGKDFPNFTSDRELMSKIYKELKKLGIK